MMGSTSEKSKKVKCMVSEDRISNLPDFLIGHILSLVPIDDVVATSVLSKRWEKLWTLITCLDLNDVILRKHKGNQDAEALQNKFKDIVYHMLLQCRSSGLHQFRLKCYQCYDASDVIAWVSTALSCNVQVLDVFVWMRDFVLLPLNLLNCQSLVELKLGRNLLVRLPTSVYLPRLKVLSLSRVKLLDDEDSVSRLIRCCPILEDLTLTECVGGNVKVFTISAPALTILRLSSLCCAEEEDDDVSRFKIVLETPKLTRFLIDDEIARGYELNDLNCISRACIDVTLDGDDSDEVDRESLQGLLEGISKVKFLRLEGPTIKAIILSECPLPIFQNVIMLELDSSEYNYARGLSGVLLTKMPCLTTLTFTYQEEGLVSHYMAHTGLSWNPPEDVPDCLLHSLKKIEIMNFEASFDGQSMVEYFLENARVLEKLIIHHNMLKVPRASNICKVEHL